MAKKKTETSQDVASPDLSHIDPDLRPLAVECSSIDFDPANVRKHSNENVAAIRGSLRRFGQTRPLVVRKSNRIVAAGNGTLAAALSLGWKWIAASVKDMDDVTAAAYSIADNQTAALATWDDEALKAMLASLPSLNDPDLDKMLADLKAEHAAEVLPTPGEGGDTFDVEAAAQGPCRVQTGDLWLIDTFVVCPHCQHENKVKAEGNLDA
jgi:ParB-like chromosome segregation protein Spo0J